MTSYASLKDRDSMIKIGVMKNNKTTGSYLKFEKNKWSIARFEPAIPSRKDSMFSTVILGSLILEDNIIENMTVHLKWIFSRTRLNF